MKSCYLSALLLSALLLSACGGRKENPEAVSLLNQARTLSESRVRTDEDRALLLLDSIHKAFPVEVELRQAALDLSRKLRIRMSEEDSLFFANQYAKDSSLLIEMDPLFVRTKYPGLPEDETLMRYKGYEPKDVAGVLFLDVHLRHDARLEMVVGYTGTQSITSVRVSDAESGDFAESDTIPVSDSGRNYRFTTDGSTRHRLTLSPEGAARVAGFVSLKANDSKRVTVTLKYGDKAVKSYTLTPVQVEAISQTYLFYAAYVEMKTLEGKQQRHALYRNRLRTPDPGSAD